MQDLELQNPKQAEQCAHGYGNCKTCVGSGCNLKTSFQTCHTCSSQFDENCSRNPSLTAIKTCKNYHSVCTTGIDVNGYILRGCNVKDETEIQDKSNRFEICERNNCNTGVYPKGRLQCIHCSGDEECNNIDSNTTAIAAASKYGPCNFFKEYDQCFTYMDEGRNNWLFTQQNPIPRAPVVAPGASLEL